MPCPLLLIRPHLSLDSLQKVGLLARPAGGAVEKNGQLVSPVTTSQNEGRHVCRKCSDAVDIRSYFERLLGIFETKILIFHTAAFLLGH